MENEYSISRIFNKYQNEIIFCGIDWLPFIRIQLHFIFFNLRARGIDNLNLIDANSNRMPIHPVRFRALTNIIKAYFYSTKSKNELVIFTVNEHITTPFNNTLINQFIDPFLFYFKEENINYDLYDLNNTNLNKINIGPLKYYFRNKVTKIFNKDLKIQNELKNFCDLIKNEYGKNLNLYYSFADAIIECQANYLSYLWYLKLNNYKKIFYYCYYNSNIMALNRAANELGIITIEYQHSQVSSEHTAYSGWQNVKSYQFFPKIIWSWNTEDTIKLNNEFSFVPNFKAITGGNVFISLYKSGIKTRKEDKYSVLISLQGIGIPQFIQDIIVSSSSIMWYLRLHPRIINQDKELITSLKLKNPEFVDVEIANNVCLYDLFSKVDYHMTSYSGTAIEAYIFGVQNIIYSNKGLKSYKNYIDNGSFFYIENYEELQSILISKKRSHIKSSGEFLNKEQIMQNIKSIFQ